MKTILKLNGRTTLALASLVSGLTLTAMAGRPDDYRQINLVSDQTGMARLLDTNLVNPWGILVGAGGNLIVADNHAGVTTFYNSAGQPLPHVISIPAPDGGPGGAVTDLGLNSSEKGFLITHGKRKGESLLLFVTEDGTIAGWNPEVDARHAVIAIDNSAAGAIYKSMALAATPHGSRLYAANFGQGVVEMYDGRFHGVKSFTDSSLTNASYAPFGIRNLGGHLFVTFAFKAAPDDGDETGGPGLGYVDEFDLEGNLVRRFASQGTLNAPWGLALAPHKFGKFKNALLVGNFGDGAVNAYDPHTGAFLGQLEDEHGNVIRIEGLWGLTAGPGPAGPSVYFTAGPGDENHGLLGMLKPEPEKKLTALSYHDAWRKLWEDHITWTRMVIMGILDSLPGAATYQDRLIDNYDDMEEALSPYYGDDADKLGDLIQDHLVIAVEILNAAKAGDTSALNDAKARWYQNADDIARFMSAMNPTHWKFTDTDNMWREHLDATFAEAVAHLTGDFAGDVAAYDKVHELALAMADFFSDGVIRQFPGRFTGVGAAKN